MQRRDVEGTFCHVVTNASGLFVNGVLCAPRSEILGASISEPRADGGCMVFLVRQNKTTSVPWYLDMPNRLESEQLLRAAGLAFDQHVLTIRLSEWTPRRVSVGSDGILLRGLLSRTFVAFPDIVEIDRPFNGFAIVDRNRGRVVVWESEVHWLADLLAMRIFEGMRVHQALNHHVEPTLASAGTTYRANADNESALEDVVIDSSRPLNVRVAAAKTLRVSKGEVGRERVRVLASTTVSPSARSALERVARETAHEAARA
ncbi:MAG: hypothetical protein ACREJX_08450 [Polyangiaceae bacterium]